MQNKIDFTNCRKVLGKAYNGANGKKIAVEYDGTEYMLKFPPSGENKPTELSYTNSCISEYIASHIFNMLGHYALQTNTHSRHFRYFLYLRVLQFHHLRNN